jgi:hypothetical protein
VKVQHRVLSCGLQELTTTSLWHPIFQTHPIAAEFCLESCRVDRSHRIGVGEMLRASAWVRPGHFRHRILGCGSQPPRLALLRIRRPSLAPA